MSGVNAVTVVIPEMVIHVKKVIFIGLFNRVYKWSLQ